MSEQIPKSLLDEVADYYSSKLATHGERPEGVDWNGEDSQFLRFQQLGKIITSQGKPSVNDLGCGYGAFYDYLGQHYADFSYRGFDVSADMVQAAEARYKQYDNASFCVSDHPDQVADYTVASGIFNVRQDRPDAEWLGYILSTLDKLNEYSKAGFSFNCLTSWSDQEKMRDYLYYADPAVLFNHCKTHYSRHVALLHDYGLYEFTILVRKEL